MVAFDPPQDATRNSHWWKSHKCLLGSRHRLTAGVCAVPRVFLSVCLFFSVIAQPGSAQASFDPSAQEIGTVTRWSHKYGTRQITYLGPDGDEFRYEWSNKTGGPANVFTIWRDGNGQLTRLEAGDVVQTYVPHNCRLTIGRCEYLYSYQHKTLADRQEKRIVITSVEDDLWSYKVYVDSETPENLDGEGTFTVDEFGIVIDSGSLRRLPARAN